MAEAGMTLVRNARTPKLRFAEVQDAVVKELQPVARSMAQSRGEVVSNWEHKPDFRGEVDLNGSKIEVRVWIENADEPINAGSTIEDLWNWLDKTGTEAHPIVPLTEGGMLAFEWGGPGSYASKTGASPARWGGPGTVQNGEMVFRFGVMHPGFPPRFFSLAINKDLRPEFNKKVDSGYRKGFRKVST